MINSINHKRVLTGCLMDNIHETPKQHSQKIPQTTYTKLPPNSFKDSNGLIEGLLGVVIYTISFFSKRVVFDWVFEGVNIP